MSDKPRNPQTDKTTHNNPVISFDIAFYAGSGYTFACVNFHRANSSRGRYPSPASLMRATRIQRKIARALPPAILHSYGGPRTVKPALVNEALTPAEPVRMCADAGCLNAADPTTPSGAFCLRHDVERHAALPDESDPRFQLLVAAAALEPETNAELRQAVD